MLLQRIVPILALYLLCLGFAGCGSGDDEATDKETPAVAEKAEAELIPVANSEWQWTGVGVSREGRIFVCFPRWSDNVPVSVGEIMSDGSLVPYPDSNWNTWDRTKSPDERFVCVQSVHVDDANRLWILDPANPKFGGVVPGGPKLISVNLDNNSIERIIHFDSTIAPAYSYLNDVRIDTEKQRAVITDSGEGALIVVDLATGESRRLLDQHHSTEAENVVVTIQGRLWKRPNGSIPKVHADGIALDNDGDVFYYHALTGNTMYRVEADALFNRDLSSEELAAQVDSLDQTGVTDGMLMAEDGYIYLSAVEDYAIERYKPGEGVQTVIKDNRLRWPDSFAEGHDGFIYVTTSQIHLMPPQRGPFQLFKFQPPQ